MVAAAEIAPHFVKYFENNTFRVISRNFLTFTLEILLKENSGNIFLTEGKGYYCSRCRRIACCVKFT